MVDAVTHPRQAITAAVNRYLQDRVTTEQERARVLLDIARIFYDFTKFAAPGGVGLDGRDGPERTGIGEIVESADRHWMAAALRASSEADDGGTSPK